MLLIGTCRPQKRKWLSSILVSALLLGAAIVPAAALGAREVEKVVSILERLSTETGKTVFYDEDAAQEWFEIDDESSQLIPAAGFSNTLWKEAFDRTMMGFIATISPAEMEKMMEEFADAIGEVAKMTPQQKQEALNALRAETGKFDAVRKRGAPYRDIVKPFDQRLRNISLRK